MHQSNRKSLFHRQNSKGRQSSRTRKFQSFYQTILPDFLDKFDDCSCLDTHNSCPYVKKILDNNNLLLAERKYIQIKKCANTKNQDEIFIRLQDNQNKILEPHLNNLLKIFSPNRVQPVFQILKHAKSEYTTFWIYAKLCQKWPKRKQFLEKIRQTAQRDNMDINFENPATTHKIDELYECKLANISEKNYLKVVKMIVKQNQFCIRIAALSLVEGRQRKGNDIINATIDYDQ